MAVFNAPAFISPTPFPRHPSLKLTRTTPTCSANGLTRRAALAAAAAIAFLSATPALAEDVDLRPKLKVSGGSASTSGGAGGRSVIKTVTRGVNLEGADFSNQTFEGVSFQQSMLRQADFSGSRLRDASFFDADLSGASFRDADLRGVNVSSMKALVIRPRCWGERA